jgi:hypothetical protein
MHAYVARIPQITHVVETTDLPFKSASSLIWSFSARVNINPPILAGVRRSGPGIVTIVSNGMSDDEPQALTYACVYVKYFVCVHV